MLCHIFCRWGFASPPTGLPEQRLRARLLLQTCDVCCKGSAPWAQPAAARVRSHFPNCKVWANLRPDGVGRKKRKVATEGPGADVAAVSCKGCCRAFVCVARLAHHWRNVKSCPLSDVYVPMGFVASAHSTKLDLLADYKEEHGDANVPAKAEYRGVKLGTWLRNTKAALVNPKKTSPEPWIVKRLAALGVAWACTAVT